MDKIEIKPMTNSQCKVMVGKRQVAYVCYGDRMPINFLTKICSGIELTDSEKLEVAKEARLQMANLNAERVRQEIELAAITGRDFTYEDTTIDGIHERPDFGDGREAAED